MNKYQVFIDLLNEKGEVVNYSTIVKANTPKQAEHTVVRVLCDKDIKDTELQNEIIEIINNNQDYNYDFYVWEVTEDDIIED